MGLVPKRSMSILNAKSMNLLTSKNALGGTRELSEMHSLKPTFLFSSHLPSQLRDCLLHPDSPLGQLSLSRRNQAPPHLYHPIRLRLSRPACVSPQGHVAFRAQRSLPASFASAARKSPLLRQARPTRTGAPLFSARSRASS